MTRRIGIYGGLFDPVHKGHIAVANTASKELKLDEMHIVPCHVPNHKQSAHCSPEHRLKMLQLATQDNPAFKINPIELEKDRTSYSVETLEDFRARFPSATLVFVLGADAFANLASWHRWRDMLTLCQFYVLSRPGSELPVRFAGEDVHSVTETTQGMRNEIEKNHFSATNTLALDVSSSKLREELLGLARSNEPPATEESYLVEWIDPKVLNYIIENGLYAQT